jgi:hypothetical protein
LGEREREGDAGNVASEHALPVVKSIFTVFVGGRIFSNKCATLGKERPPETSTYVI